MRYGLTSVILWLLSCVCVQAQPAPPRLTGVLSAVTEGQTSVPVTVAWDYPSSGGATGFDVYVSMPNLPLPSIVTVQGAEVRSATVPNIRVGQRYYLSVDAFNAEGVHSPTSTPLSIYPGSAPDPRCLFPTGDRAVTVFPTALQKTGSGGSGSRARLDFQLASPNSPIIGVAITAGPTVLASLVGTDLTALAGMWWTIPTAPGTYPLTVVASNSYGCVQTQGTRYSVVVTP